ncbi:MAG: D-2-hydroxyacid dehydrogenase [Rickettsiales bacterium]|nr:D-2-hydroxyacid dehydrogenase [Rickettsiales bacterium]
MNKIVILDKATVTKGDLTFDEIEKIAPTNIFSTTEQNQIIERTIDAEIIVTNKVGFDKNLINQLPKLKMISLFATGYDVIDIKTCKDNNIAVANVADYSSYSVVQTITAHILNLTQKIHHHNEFVKQGNWSKSEIFSCWQGKLHELSGQKFGIIGFGNIGRKLAEVMKAFGLEVIINTKNPDKYLNYDFKFVDFDELISTSDIISLNLPASQDTKNLINKNVINKMKKSAILVNCSRGKLINETELAECLLNEDIAFACLDVLEQEPPRTDNPLIKLKNCQISPHIAWATIEARKKIISETALNIKAFINGNSRNRIV